MNKKSIKILVGGILIIAVIVGIFVSVSSENMTYYYTPTEILAHPEKYADKRIRVMGLVEVGSIQWFSKETKLVFKISDETKQILKVEYKGARPDMFREGQGVVVEGKLEGNSHLAASVLLVKHSEEYKTAEHTDNKDGYTKTMEL
ncbi:MAG: cytochrome c maturation protein CcmE [SAR324 cluster bacterium]|nr:cytochrome c maturation protein CcmE [SAR324 cluster bacterium]